MKTSRLFYVMLLCGSMGWLAGACTSDEPSYEEVATVDEAKYYITGRVEADGAPAAGVTVSASGLQSATTDENGVYLLEGQEAGRDYILTFTSPGYVTTQSIASLPAKMEPNGSEVLNVVLSKQGSEVWIKRNSEATTITPLEGVSLWIPANAMKSDQRVRISAGNGMGGEKALAIAEVICSENTPLESPATLVFENKTSGNVVFEQPELYAKNPLTQTWEKSGDVTFSSEDNAYKSIVSQLGGYILRPKYTIEKGPVVTTDEINAVEEINNSGNLNAKRGVYFSIKQRAGWNYTVTPAEGIETAFPNISASDKLGLTSYIHAMVMGYTGSSEGTYILIREPYVNVSGNSHLLYTNKAKQQDVTFKIPILYYNKNIITTVKISQYTGEDISYEWIPQDVHSGGGGH